MENFSKYFPNFATFASLVPKVFDCISFVHVHSHSKRKLDPRAIKCIFVGYSSTKKGYKCYCPPTQQLYFSFDVSFVELESYLNHPYLQGETSLMEDMDTRDFFLLDLPSCMSKPSQSQSSVFEPVFEHSQIPKPKSPPSGKQVPSSTRPTLVYSRKKTTIIEPM